MPSLLPINKLSGLVQFLGVNRSQSAGHLDVLEKEIQRIHVKGRREIVQRCHGYCGRLRVVWSTPRPLRSDVVLDRRVLLSEVWDLENVRQRRRAAGLNTARAPTLGFPGYNRAVPPGSNLDMSISRRPAPGYFEFARAL